MTLIATWGGAESNSYLNLTSANSYIGSAIFNHSAWDALSPAQREAALIEATRDIDAYTYIGGRYWYDQMLEFPRELSSEFPWNRTESGSTVFSVDFHRMQVAVEQATCHQAVWLARNGGRNLHADATANNLKSWSQTAGPTSESYTYGGGKIERLCSQALALIAPWRTSKKVYRG